MAKINVQDRLNAIGAKNTQIEKVRQLQEENYKLKQQMGKSKKGSRQRLSSRIPGLQTLRNTLGKQFSADSDN
jgi:hypothetical protein